MLFEITFLEYIFRKNDYAITGIKNYSLCYGGKILRMVLILLLRIAFNNIQFQMLEFEHIVKRNV